MMSRPELIPVAPDLAQRVLSQIASYPPGGASALQIQRGMATAMTCGDVERTLSLLASQYLVLRVPQPGREPDLWRLGL
jgi:hypothetical protein